MRFHKITMLAALGLIPLMGSCNENNFSGGSSGPSSAADSDSGDPGCTGDPEADEAAGLTCGTTDGPSGGPKECVEGDKVNIQWTGPVKECLDQGKTYNFEQKACAEMRQAQFDCNWDNVTAELEKRSLLTEVLRSDSQNGAKLVSCGQSEDGNRIVVQWIKAENAQNIDCSDGASSHHTTTGCYTLYTNGEKPPETTSEEEKRQQVFACMNEL